MISRRLLVIAALALALVSSSAIATLARAPEVRTAKLDETLRQLLEGRSTPGIAVLILQDGQPVYSRSMGAREPAVRQLPRTTCFASRP